jgi:glycosyltransferase involved in cell wall biosynthesis
VVLAVRDGVRWLPESVDSILGQSYPDVELVVVDDGSRDGSADWVAGRRDSRLVLLRNERSEGLSAALNRGLAAVSGDYVARMDADDAAHPERLRIQVGVLERRPDVGLVGSRIETVDESGRPHATSFDPPEGEALVAWRLLLFSNPVCHPTVLFRRSLLREVGGYDTSLTTSQDRDLWSRMLLVSRIVNVPERLVRYRVHANSVSVSRAAEQRRNSLAIRRSLLRRFLGGDDPGRAIERWYDPQFDEAAIRALRALFLETYEGLVRRLDPPEQELRLVREDLASRLDSIRRRDGRIEPRIAARVALRRILPGFAQRGLARLRRR